MSDIEITEACAAAMGLKQWSIQGVAQYASSLGIFVCDEYKDCGYSHYAPLHDDAQCLALVKKFELRCQEPEELPSSDRRWRVTAWTPVKTVAQHDDLNRAICLCVAHMQQAKGECDAG